MRKLLLPLVLLLTPIAISQQTNQSVDINGVTRDYIQYLPNGFDAGTESLPVVFCLHGLGDNAQNMSGIGLNIMSDTARFIPIYPQGITNNYGQTAWNNGTLLSSNVDDLSFFNAMMNLMINDYNVDPTRIYVCGFSMGAIMSYHLACNMNDRIAAIGVMSGAMSTNDYNSCSPNYLTPVIHIHGTNDATVPYDSGALPTLQLATQSFQFWRNQHSCAPAVDSTRFADTASDGLTFDDFVVQGCAPNASVELIRVNGGTHTYFYEPVNDITEIHEIWRFFRLWSNSNPAPAGINEISLGSISFYPNPVNDQLIINTESDSRIEIYDGMGRKLEEVRIYKGENTIQLNHLKSGVYYIRHGQETKKLIKQ